MADCFAFFLLQDKLLDVHRSLQSGCRQFIIRFSINIVICSNIISY